MGAKLRVATETMRPAFEHAERTGERISAEMVETGLSMVIAAAGLDVLEVADGGEWPELDEYVALALRLFQAAR